MWCKCFSAQLRAPGLTFLLYRYGHAAARGLDLRPYSFGLDSAAVYGGSFSALVVEGSQSGLSTSRAKPSQKLEFTDVSISGRAAKVYSMKTKKPKH